MFISFKICRRVKKQNYKKCVSVQKCVDLTVNSSPCVTTAITYKCKSFVLNLTVSAEHGQAVIESAAVFLFETFHNKDHVGTEETRTIKQMFGPFPSSAAEASCASVARLVALLGDFQVEDFIQSQSSRRNLKRSSAFGRNIAFSYDCYTLDPLEDLPFSTMQEETTCLDFINFFNNHKSRKKDSSEGLLSTERPLNSGDRSILRTEVDKYLCRGNMMSSNPEELCTSLFEMLASHRSNDELQNEVCIIGIIVFI